MEELNYYISDKTNDVLKKHFKERINDTSIKSLTVIRPFSKKQKNLPDNIELLVINCKTVTYLPASSTLRFLYIYRSGYISNIPEYENLEELYIFRSCSKLPIFNNLRILYIEDCGNFNLPNDYKSLETLVLQDTMSMTFPPTDYDSLTTLQLCYIYEYMNLNLKVFPKLVQLDLTSVGDDTINISSVPPSLVRLLIDDSYKVEYVYFPNILAEQLKYLIFNNNISLEGISDSFPNLEYLETKMEKLPKFMPKLETLVLHNIHAIGDFPNSLCSLKKLYIHEWENYEHAVRDYILPIYIGYTLKVLYCENVHVHFYKDTFHFLEYLFYMGASLPSGLHNLKKLYIKLLPNQLLEDIENYKETIKNSPDL